jgi:hypothetical protein
MPRTAVNLPELLQAQGDGARPATGAADDGNNADDLLAQLAGEEVDRLLSEADDAPSGKKGDFDLPGAGSADLNPADEAEASLDELFSELNADTEIASRVKAAPAAPAPVAAPIPVQPPTAPLAAPVAKSAPPTAAPPVPTITPSQPAPVAATASEPASAADALAAEMEEDAREHAAALRRMKGDAAPAQPAPAPAAAPTAPPAPEPETVAGLELVAESEVTSGITIDLQAIADQAADAANSREPFLVRVLELINAPLAGFSETMRAAIGKIALVTTLNAVGVFIYVLVFRRH